MPDEIDRAQAREEQLRDDALSVYQRGRPALDPDDWEILSACECDDCGERIPDARRKAVPGVTRCIDCQEFKERHT